MFSTKIRTTIATLVITLTVALAGGSIVAADAPASRPTPVATEAQPALSIDDDARNGRAQARRCRKIGGRWWCRLFPDVPTVSPGE